MYSLRARLRNLEDLRHRYVVYMASCRHHREFLQPRVVLPVEYLARPNGLELHTRNAGGSTSDSHDRGVLHYETRVRVVYYTDSNGNTQSRTETYTEKVTTFIDQDEFSFGSWVDVSKREMPPIGHSSLTRLKIDPCILFGDQETADDYASQVAAMIERNRHRDVHTDYSAKRQIPGLKKRISTYVDLNVRPWWIRTGYFWLATVLMMTWPYRWLFRAKTGKTYYILKKKMYKSTTPPTEVDITDPIAVLSNNAPFLVALVLQTISPLIQ